MRNQLRNELSHCYSLIKDHFQLPTEELVLRQNNYDELELKLAVLINNLLNSDLTRLMNAFYRIDLDEIIFKKIVADESPDQIGLSLAKEVIKRELLKVKTREKYRNS